MKTKPEEVNELTNVRVEKIGLCRHPAVPDAEFVLMKSIDGPVDDPPARDNDESNAITNAVQQAVISALSVIQKIRGAERPKERDMDISKMSVEELQKANPSLYDAIVKKVLEGVKTSRGSRVGESEHQASVDESAGARVGENSVADATEDAVAERLGTVQPPPKDTASGDRTGASGDLNDLAEARAKAAEARYEALAANQQRMEKSLGEMATTLKALMAKIDTSRAGEEAIEREKLEAKKQNERAIDEAREAGDSGIGAVKTEEPDTAAAFEAELDTLKSQVEALTKSVPEDAIGRVERLEKAVAKMLRERVAVEKTAADEPVVKARSTQAGWRDEASVRSETVKKRTNIFDGAISTIALARSSRE